MGVRRKYTGGYDPGSMYFWAGLLMCLTVGLVAAGVYETWVRHMWIMVGVCLATEAACFAMYFYIVYLWMFWMNLTGDYADVAEDVVFGNA